MSRFSLQIPSESSFDLFHDSKSRSSFRYDRNLLEENLYPPHVSKARQKHQKRIIHPLHSNLKLKKVLADKTTKHFNSENSLLTSKKILQQFESGKKIERMIGNLKDITQIAEFQNKRMGIHPIQASKTALIGGNLSVNIFNDGNSPQYGLTEGQILKQKALSLCRKSKDHTEKIYGAPIIKEKPSSLLRVTSGKQNEGQKLSNMAQKQFKSDIRFRYVKRKMLLLRSLNQIAEDNQIKTYNKENLNEERSIFKYSQPPERKSAMLPLSHSSIRQENFIELKTEPSEAENFYHSKTKDQNPSITSLEQSLLNKGQTSRHIRAKTSRRESMNSNITFINTMNHLHDQQGKPFYLKEAPQNHRLKKSNKSLSLLYSGPRKLSSKMSLFSSKKLRESSQSLNELDDKPVVKDTAQHPSWNFITYNQEQHNTSLHQTLEPPEKKLNIKKISRSKVQLNHSHSNLIKYRGSVKDEDLRSRNDLLNIKGVSRYSSRLSLEASSSARVNELLQIIHKNNGISPKENNIQSKPELPSMNSLSIFNEVAHKSAHNIIPPSCPEISESSTSLIADPKSILERFYSHFSLF